MGKKTPLPRGAVGVVKANGRRILVYRKKGEKREQAIARVLSKHTGSTETKAGDDSMVGGGKTETNPT